MDKVKNQNNLIMTLLKGAFVAVSFSLVLILVFALLIKYFNISESLILPINQGIKIVSIFMGIMTAFNRYTTRGFVKGFLIGVIYTILAYLIFSILAKEFSYSLTSFTDSLFGGIIGGISGIIVANIKK